MVWEAHVTDLGKLEDRYLPAVYFDTSVVVDYWMTEGMEWPETEMDKLLKQNTSSRVMIVRDMLRPDARMTKVGEMRKRLILGDPPRITPIVSPLCLLELIEWHAETIFKEIASEAAGVKSVQRMGKKEIGDYIKKIFNLRMEEIDSTGKHENTDLEMLVNELGPPELHESLECLWYADIVAFDLPWAKTWNDYGRYTYLQLGASDTLHILFAQHLGCQYFASFDSDFNRVKDLILEDTGITVLATPEEILAVL